MKSALARLNRRHSEPTGAVPFEGIGELGAVYLLTGERGPDPPRSEALGGNT